MLEEIKIWLIRYIVLLLAFPIPVCYCVCCLSFSESHLLSGLGAAGTPWGYQGSGRASPILGSWGHLGSPRHLAGDGDSPRYLGLFGGLDHQGLWPGRARLWGAGAQLCWGRGWQPQTWGPRLWEGAGKVLWRPWCVSKLHWSKFCVGNIWNLPISTLSEVVVFREPTETGRQCCHPSQGESNKENAREFISPYYTNPLQVFHMV